MAEEEQDASKQEYGNLPDMVSPFAIWGGDSDTVGVHLAHGSIRLARVKRATGRAGALNSCSIVPLQNEVEYGSVEFKEILKKALGDFCKGQSKSAIWVSTAFPSMQVRHIRVPKVARKDLANAVYWTFKKETPIEEGEVIFDFVFEGEVLERGIRKVAVTAYAVEKKEVDELREIFSSIGFPLRGMTVPFFAYRNLLQSPWIETGQTTVLLCVEDDYSEITVFSKDHVALSRNVKAGLNTLALSIQDSASRALNRMHAKNLIFGLGEDWALETSSPPGSDFSGAEIFNMILPALTRLIRQIETTLESYFENTELDRVKDGERLSNICVCGEIVPSKAIVNYIGTQTGLDPVIVDPFDESAISKGLQPPQLATERARFAPAVGLALSENSRTPNLLYTYKSRENEANIRKINRLILAIFSGFILVGAGVYLFQNKLIENGEAETEALKTKLESYRPELSSEFIQGMVLKVAEKHRSLRKVAGKYLGAAVIGDVSRFTPDDVNLESIRLDNGPIEPILTEEKKKKPGARPQEHDRVVVIEGFIEGETSNLEAKLAEYVLALEGSPLVRGVETADSNVKFETGIGRLDFTLKMNLVEIGANKESDAVEAGG